MRRDHRDGWRVGLTSLTAGLALVFLLSPVYGESPPPHDADGLRQTICNLQDRIERLEADQSLREVEQEHEELRPRSGDRLTFLQEGATLTKVVAGPEAMIGVVAT